MFSASSAGVRRPGLPARAFILLLVCIEAAATAPSAGAMTGRVLTFGMNDVGQLGDGTTTSPSLPAPALGISPQTELYGNLNANGYKHGLAVNLDGTVAAWGDNTRGELGDGTTITRLRPVLVKGPGGVGSLSNITAVAGGNSFSLALKRDGTVWSWGYNGFGQLGEGTFDTNPHSMPAQVVGPGGVGSLTGVTSIAAGGNSSYALKNDGTVVAWGYNFQGELGDGSTVDHNVPVQVPDPSGVGPLRSLAAISGGDAHALALKSDGTVYAWGNNASGELGDNSTIQRHLPVQVVGVGGFGVLSGVAGIAAGANHSVAVLADGGVVAWGYNGYGELGDGTTTQRQFPVRVLGIGGVGFLDQTVQVAAGQYHTMARRIDGTLVGWGADWFSQLGDGASATRLTPVQTLNPAGSGPLTGVISVAAAFYFTSVLQIPPPIISSFTPTSGNVGVDVTITGTSFTGATGVAFNGAATLAFQVISDTQIDAMAPLGATTGPISVTTPSGTGVSATNFTVPGPAVTGFNPGSGNMGTLVTITGTGFSGATAVAFNGAATQGYQVISDSLITTLVPLGATTGPISVTTPAGTGASAASFTAPGPAAVTFSPASSNTGDLVTITGTGFSGATVVAFNGAPTQGFDVISDTQINAFVPLGTTTGPISVTTYAGTASSASNFTVNAPAISNFSPTSGSVGTTEALSGSGFSGATAVTFAGPGATRLNANYIVNSDSSITAYVPLNAVTGTISVITPHGTGTSASSFTVS